MTPIPVTTRNALISGLFGSSLRMEEKKEVSKIPTWIYEALGIKEENEITLLDKELLSRRATNYFTANPVKINEAWNFISKSLQSNGHLRSISNILSTALQSETIAIPEIKGDFNTSRRGFLQAMSFLVTQAAGGNPLMQVLGRNRSHGAVPNPILVFTSEEAKTFIEDISVDFDGKHDGSKSAYSGSNYIRWIELEKKHYSDRPHDESTDIVHETIGGLIQHEIMVRSTAFSELREKLAGRGIFSKLKAYDQEQVIADSLWDVTVDNSIELFDDLRKNGSDTEVALIKAQARYQEVETLRARLGLDEFINKIEGNSTIRDGDLDELIKLVDSSVDFDKVLKAARKEANETYRFRQREQMREKEEAKQKEQEEKRQKEIHKSKKESQWHLRKTQSLENRLQAQPPKNGWHWNWSGGLRG